jgi:hypothetical protein
VLLGLVLLPAMKLTGRAHQICVDMAIAIVAAWVPVFFLITPPWRHAGRHGAVDRSLIRWAI